MFGRARVSSSNDVPEDGRGSGVASTGVWQDLLRVIEVVPVPGPA